MSDPQSIGKKKGDIILTFLKMFSFLLEVNFKLDELERYIGSQRKAYVL